jgi:photosystem II stability/assembly factor-like uncharacterized protein
MPIFKHMRLNYLFLLLFLSPGNFLSSQNLAHLADSFSSGFRGLSVVDENITWISGRKGLVGNSTDGGKSWNWNRVKGFENSDFRSLHAFDKTKAVIATAGFPAAILFTTDAGKSWTTSYSSKDSAMFFDGIDFWDNKHGIIFGDPINGKMYLSETFDGGKTWKEIPFEQRPQLENGEAAFAASGTTIRTLPGGHVYIATGGSISRLWHSRDYGHHWEVFATPILQGKPSQGTFSLDFKDTLNGVIVGGDYSNDVLQTDNCFYTVDGGRTWNRPEVSTGGYRSCVSFINEHSLIATGTSGTDISDDGGKNWRALDTGGGFNTVAVVKKYPDLYFAGSKKKFISKIGLR